LPDDRNEGAHELALIWISGFDDQGGVGTAECERIRHHAVKPHPASRLSRDVVEVTVRIGRVQMYRGRHGSAPQAPDCNGAALDGERNTPRRTVPSVRVGAIRPSHTLRNHVLLLLGQHFRCLRISVGNGGCFI
jgi:hypothetical protein